MILLNEWHDIVHMALRLLVHEFWALVQLPTGIWKVFGNKINPDEKDAATVAKSAGCPEKQVLGQECQFSEKCVYRMCRHSK